MVEELGFKTKVVYSSTVAHNATAVEAALQFSLHKHLPFGIRTWRQAGVGIRHDQTPSKCLVYRVFITYSFAAPQLLRDGKLIVHDSPLPPPTAVQGLLGLSRRP